MKLFLVVAAITVAVVSAEEDPKVQTKSFLTNLLLGKKDEHKNENYQPINTGYSGSSTPFKPVSAGYASSPSVSSGLTGVLTGVLTGKRPTQTTQSYPSSASFPVMMDQYPTSYGQPESRPYRPKPHNKPGHNRPGYRPEHRPEYRPEHRPEYRPEHMRPEHNGLGNRPSYSQGNEFSNNGQFPQQLQPQYNSARPTYAGEGTNSYNPRPYSNAQMEIGLGQGSSHYRPELDYNRQPYQPSPFHSG